MNDSIRTFIHTKQSNTHRHNPNNQSNDINVGFTSNTNFRLFQLRKRKFCSIHIQTPQWIGQISHISSITNFVRFIDSQNLYLSCRAISYISYFPTWICYRCTTQVFSSGIWEFFKITFENISIFVEHLRTTAAIKCHL